jgi:hypothetical protein
MGERISITSTKSQIEEFKESLIWKDIVTELDTWLEGFRQEQDGIVEDAATSNPSTASVLMHMGDLNGRRKAIMYVLGLPDMFISILKDKISDSEELNSEVSDGE